MKLDRQPSYLSLVSGPYAPPSCSGAGDVRDDVLEELRELWPNTVDLVKRPGTLYRLHALLNA
ncbi:MAG: hypothetical protein ACKVPY_04310 [Paracoccaceae bacterium]